MSALAPLFTMTVPYLRTSPLYIPRRDLVLAYADSFLLRVTIVDADNPDAQPIELTNAIGGPSVQLYFWADVRQSSYYDYPVTFPQTFISASARTLWQGTGVMSGAPGTFDFTFPSGSVVNWPLRCGWALQLNYDLANCEVLATGRAHIRYVGLPFTLATPALTTDTYIPIITSDTLEQVLA